MRRILFFLSFIIVTSDLFSQCGASVPVFTVNLVGNPSGTWTSPGVVRFDTCCGTTAPDVCVKFVITLDSNAVGINFSIASGAVPGGALFYQVDCGPHQSVGSPICLSGPGPHILTFCKPGNNSNTYQITSVPAPTAGNNITINQGCSGVLSVTGFNASTVTWSSIYPGVAGAYNNYLSCSSGCTTTTVNATSTPPAYIDYKVCGTPAALCFQSTTVCDTVRVYFNPTLAATILPSNPVVCFGQTTATLTVVGSGGTTPYNYHWNTGSTAQTVTVGAGPYSVILGDASGCPPVIANTTVTSFTIPITANAGPDKTVCNQNPTTSITGTVTGASGGIWSGGQGSYSPSNTTLTNMLYTPTAGELASGHATLILTTTGNGGCPGSVDTVRINYQGFTGTINVTGTNVSCFSGSDGTASASVSGGVSPFTYTWTTAPQQIGANATGLSSGTYSVLVTDALGCTSVASETITQPLPLNTSYTVQNVSCFGGNNASISLTVTGGTPAYTYNWAPNVGNSSAVSNLSAGIYTVTIKDSKGCALTQTISVTQPTALNNSFALTNVSCFNGNNGSISSTVSGGTAPYTYQWSPTGGNGATASNLSAGSYSLLVTDAKNCTSLFSTAITQPTQLQVNVSSTNETCDYLNNGTATATVSGGQPAYVYQWQPGNLPGSSVSNLSSGNYTLTVTDNNGCKVVSLATITQPPTLTLSIISASNINCFGGNNGSLSVNASGGTPSYIYSWQPNVSSGPTATGLSSGSYTITTNDSKGCAAQLVTTLTQPTASLTATANSGSVSCNGGSNGTLSSSASGGTAPYTFNWSPINISGQNVVNVGAGNYSVLITDANGCTASASTVVTQPAVIGLSFTPVNSTCSMSNGQVTVNVSGGNAPYTYQWAPIGGNGSTAVGLPAGSYNVTVTDFHGCVIVGGIIINDNAGPNASIISTSNVSCYGGANGSATVGTAGGTGPFTYVWQPFGGNGPTATGLTAGTYTVTVVDVNGCTSLATTSPAITQPTQVQINITKNNVSCFGGSDGSAFSSVSGGTPGYTYTWSPGGTNGTSVGGLSNGTYTLQVTDANSCLQTQQVTIAQPTVLTTTITLFTNVSCFGGSNGSASASVSGGTAPYHYNWTSGSISQTALGLSAGTYTVFVTDAKGCSANASITITEPSQALSVTAISTPVSCFGGSDGTATATPTGGTPGYSYNWSGAGSTQTVSNLNAGTHFVTVTDNNGCTAINSISVGQPSAITATLAFTNATCGNANGNISAQVTGGTNPYTYSWSPISSTNSSVNGLATGTYSVLVTDVKNCTATFTASIINVPGPTVSIASSSNVSCFGGNDGTATVNIIGGTLPYSYNWQPYGGITTTASGLSVGTFTVLVNDANGCSSSISVIITQPNVLSVSIASQTQPSCFGGNNGSITATVSGGTSSYVYNWSPSGGNAATGINLSQGTYTLTVTDQKGCTDMITSSLTQPTLLQSSILSTVNPTCYNGTNGSITAGASGGTPTYQFTWQTTPQQTTPQATGLSQGTYTVIVTDTKSCTSTVTATLTQPQQVITLGGNNDSICLGQSAVLSVSASGGSGNYFYYWFPSINGTASSQTVSPVSNTNYAVTAYDMNGCAGKADTLHVKVFSLVAGNVMAFANSPICPGQGTLVYATVSGNPGPLTYNWTNNLGNGPGGYWVVPNQPTNYVVTVSNSCGTTVRDTARVTFNPPPTVLINPDILNGCAPLKINFRDSSKTGNPTDPITNWSWIFGDGSSSTQQDPTHTYNNAGTYNVVLTVATSQGCTNNNGLAPTVVTINPKPIASFTVNSHQLDLPYDLLQCTNLSSGATNYNWDFGDGGNSVQVDPKYLYTTVGNFTVELIATSQFGCKDTARTFVTTNSNVVFPNAFTPSDNGSGGYYNSSSLDNDIFFPYTAGVMDYHLMIFNRWGELIFESVDIKQGWDGTYRDKPCQQDVYVWKAHIKFTNGKTFDKVGDVTLLR